MSGNPVAGVPVASEGAADPYAPQQQSYSFSGPLLLTTILILASLTVVFVFIRVLLYQFVMRSGGGGRGRGGLAAGILLSINSFGRSSGRHGLDASALSALPVTAYRKEDCPTGAAGADCAVCLSELVDCEKVRELPNCGHLFHVECVDAWLRSRTTCPLCRAEAEPKRNGKGKAEVEAAQLSSATAPPPPALSGAGGRTLIVTVEGGFPDTRRDVRGSTSGIGQSGSSYS